MRGAMSVQRCACYGAQTTGGVGHRAFMIAACACLSVPHCAVPTWPRRRYHAKALHFCQELLRRLSALATCVVQPHPSTVKRAAAKDMTDILAYLSDGPARAGTPGHLTRPTCYRAGLEPFPCCLPQLRASRPLHCYAVHLEQAFDGGEGAIRGGQGAIRGCPPCLLQKPAQANRAAR